MDCWQSQNSMTDSSTTMLAILDLIVADRWAQRQLHSCIKDVSVTSELMKLLTIIVIVFIGPLALPELNVRFLHNR